ncbi:MAG: hypothetical protein HYW47_06110 [Deltaproteobacteria bacterium]|nr:hypothetical protein [Deltaproteobacteria bacterium]
MRKKIIFSFVFSLVCLSSAGAQTITSIRIVGTHKIEKAVIYKNLTSKKGEVYTSSSVRRDIKKLYELGYFENISVYKKDVSQGVELSYVIEEKPIIKDILTHGFHEIDKEDIEALISLKKYSFLNISDVKRVQEAILNLYTEKGFTLSDVRYEISQKDKNNQIEVHFYISEVAKVAIKKITFVGNHALSSEELKSKMFTKEKDIWYWITDSGVFKEEIFQRDVSQGLVYYYLMNGYVDIKISEPQITLSHMALFNSYTSRGRKASFWKSRFF